MRPRSTSPVWSLSGVKRTKLKPVKIDVHDPTQTLWGWQTNAWSSLNLLTSSFDGEAFAVVAKSDETSEAAPTARVFISYSRKDMAFADRLEAALKARGFEPLIDRTEIYAFEDWWSRIQALISRADTVVFVLSPDAVASDVALKEVAYAASLNKRFAPIVCQRVADDAIPEALRRQWLGAAVVSRWRPAFRRATF
jgi:hypothetical protein